MQCGGFKTARKKILPGLPHHANAEYDANGPTDHLPNVPLNPIGPDAGYLAFYNAPSHKALS
jgi:hypothetical protein